MNSTVISSVTPRFSAAARGAAALISLLLAALLVGGCAGSSQHRIENWRNTDGSYTPDYALLEKQKQAVDVYIFRQPAAGSELRSPVNIYVNGEYQGSLVNNAYTLVRLCPGSHTLSAWAADASDRYRGKKAGSEFTIAAGSPAYFEAGSAPRGAVSLRQSDAQAMHGVSRRQSHTIARVSNPKCG